MISGKFNVGNLVAGAIAQAWKISRCPSGERQFAFVFLELHYYRKRCWTMTCLVLKTNVFEYVVLHTMPTTNKTLFAYMYSAIALLPEMMQNHDVLCFGKNNVFVNILRLLIQCHLSINVMFNSRLFEFAVQFAFVWICIFLDVMFNSRLFEFCIITGNDAEPWRFLLLNTNDFEYIVLYTMPTNNKALFANMHSAIALLPEMMQNHDVLCFVTTMFCIYFAAVDSMPYIHKKTVFAYVFLELHYYH